ncbi:MAG: S41 family peptidase [Synechococcales bacterium]|nr:S41 family peptidase [Synechococcales bacterium]
MSVVPAAPETTRHTQGYYRFPALHDQTIVFTAEGDLWTVPVTGGRAQRLTTHHGVESHAAISPDGTRIAFSAQYEGPTEVYTMPVAGGLPTRHTYEGEVAVVVGWTPDGQVLYSTAYYSTLPNAQLAVLNPATGEQSLLPLHQASDGTFTADGKTLFFTRLAFQGSHTKRYQGGTAQNIWKFTQGEPEAIALTADYPGTSRSPMWWEGRVYFVSDRDGTLNLWSMTETGNDLRQHTFHKGWDVQSPTLHQGRIVYQLGADLYLHTLATETDECLDIYLASDFDQTRERWVNKPLEYLTSLHLSPRGDRLVLTARGRVFVAPVEQGRLVAATRDDGVRYRSACFLPDGKSLLALTDETGELEFCQIPANGVGRPTLLTGNGTVFRYAPVPALDGKSFAFIDKDHQLWIHHLESGETQRIAVAEEVGNFGDLRWSPDSQWLAFTMPAANLFTRIFIYSVADGTMFPLTSDRVDSFSPAWSPDGKWLYFLSDRAFYSIVASPWGPRQPEPYFDRTTKIYQVGLKAEERSPFLPMDEIFAAAQEEKDAEKSDDAADSEVEVADEQVDADPDQPPEADSEEVKKSRKGKSKEPVVVQIDLDNLPQRVMEVPIAPGNYRQLWVTDKKLFWLDREASLEPKSKLLSLEIKAPPVEAKTVMEDIRSFELSPDGKKLLISKKKKNGQGNGADLMLYVIDATKDPPKDKELEKKKVDLSRWRFSVQPRLEWRQLFVEAWRLERDYFYDRNLHGIDWQGLLKKHLPLVDRVTDRDELNDLIAHLVGELAALHTFVRAGDRRSGQDRIHLASLGAKLSPVAEGYRIDYIYQTDPDYLDRLAPLARPGLNLQPGDVIELINGVPARSVPHPAVLLKHQADQQVLLHVKSATTQETRPMVVQPINPRDAWELRYADWECRCRQRVEEWGGGRIGYVHLRAMTGDTYHQWVENYYPIFNRDGLIIDVRHNRGGNTDSWVLEKLLRKAWFYWQPRIGKPFWNMQWAFRGHMVVLCNEHTASDGEAFTEGFRRLGLGKVIGTRTWGGEIWLSLQTWLVDRGVASAAEIGVYGPEGDWLIEGHGVEPDIVVDNLPHATFNGQDAQLEAAVKYLQQQIQQHPVEIPPTPPYPIKAFPYENS